MISIHLMLRFIKSLCHVELVPTAISIHLMLRFIIFLNHDQTYLTIFQYISCYGLSERCIAMLQVLENFNTSHVTVYHEKPVEYDVKADYFNTSHVTVYHQAP